jgi:hypothetical protein
MIASRLFGVWVVRIGRSVGYGMNFASAAISAAMKGAQQ